MRGGIRGGDEMTGLRELVAMSARLGKPENDYVILGEGNTSARINDDLFYVKASGTELRTIKAEGMVRVRFETVLKLLDAEGVDDQVMKDTLAAASVDAGGKRPSVETVMHAFLLQLEGVSFVAHTHPTVVNAITCAKDGQQAFVGRLFPDEIVCCGVAPIWVPYTDPGIDLARQVRDQVRRYVEEHGLRPKVILMQNHGMIALGSSPDQVLMITAMMVKTARIIAGAYAMGGPAFLAVESVNRIHTRPDELHRRKVLADKG
mgnify:CR=1 FL=1